jgi:hypothetical protein
MASAAPAPPAAPPTLSLRAAFGINASLQTNAAWLDATTLLYVAGGFLVRLNVATRAQSFSVLPGLEGAPATGGGPTALAVSPSKRYLAVAMVDADDGAFISIFSTRTLARRKVLSLSLGAGAPGMAGGAVTALAFSSDDAWLGAVGTAPSWSLGVFSVDRGRLCALLELLLRRHDEVLPRSLIASQVWDMNFDSDTNVIEVAMRRLRGKIDEDHQIKLIQTVRGMGYVLEAPEGR